ncbi:hypothetical protein I4F81_002124 [Pyropia yezoensis]|uniref:Uncharacterized protein n=1 Tax=Pyropia yezoensis TaxID=2788 RepID=A0ACC3BNN0_PYRYE|nr:hypothetical protein I4F81_002124 [Neopyropia yezoensis]
MNGCLQTLMTIALAVAVVTTAGPVAVDAEYAKMALVWTNASTKVIYAKTTSYVCGRRNFINPTRAVSKVRETNVHPIFFSTCPTKNTGGLTVSVNANSCTNSEVTVSDRQSDSSSQVYCSFTAYSSRSFWRRTCKRGSVTMRMVLISNTDRFLHAWTSDTSWWPCGQLTSPELREARLFVDSI